MRLIAFAALPVLLLGQAAAQNAPTELEMALLGEWKCSAEADGMKVNAVTDYKTGGTQDFEVNLAGAPGGMAMEIAGAGSGTWKFVDGKLVEGFVSITVTSAKLNGQVVPNETAQPMVEGILLGQTMTSTVEMNTGSMVLVDQNNVTNTCTR